MVKQTETQPTKDVNKKFLPIWANIVLSFLGLAICAGGAGYFFGARESRFFGWVAVIAAIACFIYGAYKANQKHNED